MSSPVWKCFSLITSSSSVIMSSPVWKCFSLITSSSVIMSPPVWKWCLAHYVIICDHVSAGLEVVSRSLRHHLWTCLRRSGSGVSLITSSSVIMSSPVWKCFSLITSSSVIMSSPVWKCFSLITSSSVIMSSPVWKWCLAHYVIICDHVFAGLEVFLAHYVTICDHVFAGLEVVSRSLRHHLWSCLRRSGSVSRSLRHHLWSCLHRSGSGVALITSSSVIMSSPVWKCFSLITSSSVIMSSPVWKCFSLITSPSVIMSSPVWKCFSLITSSSSVIMSPPVWKWCLAHYVIICEHVFAGLEVVSRSLRHHLWSCLRRSGSVSRSLRHHLWSCLRRSGSGVSLITSSSSVIMSSPVWKWCRAHYVIICDHVFAGLEVFLAHYVIICDHVFAGLEGFLAHYVIICNHVSAGLEVFLAHYVIICDHVFAGLEVVSRSLRHHHLWSCLRRSGSVSRSLRHHLWSCLRRSGSVSRSLRHHLWTCLHRSGSGVSLITSSSVIMSSPVWKWCLAHYVIICDHVFAGLEVVSRSLRHHLWSCLRRSGSGVSLITSSSVIMSSPVWKWCLAHYVIICDHVFAGLEVVSRSLRHHLWSCLRRSGSGVSLITSSSVIMSSPVWKWCRAHYVIICDHVFAGLEVVSRSLRHHLWSCLRRSGSGVSLITSSSVIMSSPVWKWCLAHYVIICDHVFAGLEVVSRSLRHHLWSCLRRSGSVSRSLRHHLWSCLRRSGSVSRSLRHHLWSCLRRSGSVSRSLRHHLWSCLRRSGSVSRSLRHHLWSCLRRSGSVSRSLRHHLWSCLRRSGSGVSLITSSSVIMSSPVWKWCLAHYVIISDHVFAGLEVVSRSLRHHLWSCLRRSGSVSRSLRHHLWSCLRRSGSGVALITSSSVIMSSPVWKWCLAHYVIICDHVFAGLEVVSRSLRHHLWSCLRRSGSGVSLITSSSVIMSSPVWKWCLAHYVIICDHVFAGLEVVSRSLRHHLWSCLRRSGSGVSLITSSSVIMSSPVWKWCRAHYVIICDHVFAGLEVVSRSLRHHLWSCLRRSGSGVSLITSSSVIMSSPVWKWCLAHYVIICDHVFAGLEVVSRSLRHHLWSCLRRSGSVSRSLRHHLWSCLRRSGSVSRSLRHHLWSCLRRSGSVSRSLRHHLWSCLRRSGSGVSLITSSSVIMSSPVWKCFLLITSSSVIMSSPVWKWCLAHYVIICDHVFAGLEVFLAHYVIICDHVFAGLEVFLAHYVIICDHVFAGLEVVSRSLRHHLWSCLRRSGSGVSLITSSSVIMSSPVWKCFSLITSSSVIMSSPVWKCFSLITSSSVIMSSPVWKWCRAHYVIICDHVFTGLEVFLAHYVIICDHVFAGLEVVSRSLRHHLWSCLRRSGSGVSLITSSSVIMSSPVWKWCRAHYVIICDHVFAGLEVFLAHYVIICDHVFTGLEVFLAHYVIICDHVFTGLEVFLAHYVIICDHVFAGLEVVSRSLRHHLWSCLHRSGSVSRSLRHHLWSCLHRSGSGVALITSSSVIMSSPVWKWCRAHYVIICDHVFAGLEVFLAHYVIICDHVFASLEVFLAHYFIICDHVFAGLEVVSRLLRHHLWSCLRRSGSGVALITSSSVIMSSPVWKWCRAHYVIICDHVFAGLEVVSRSLRHHLWSCLRRSGSGVALITSSSVIMSSPVWKWCRAHYVIICDHVFAGLEVVSRSLRHHLWSCLHRSGSGVALITSSSVIMSSPVWKCFALITSSSVIMSSPVWKCFSVAEEDNAIAICDACSTRTPRGGKKHHVLTQQI